MTIVAVKKLTGVNQTAFLREAKIMQQIPNHPNVVTFYGMAASQNVLYIVTEFVPHGSLAVRHHHHPTRRRRRRRHRRHPTRRLSQRM